MGWCFMKCRIIRDAATFGEMEGAWNELVGISRFRAPFYSWAWQSIWWRHFGRDSELFLVTAEDAAGRLMALAPLMKRQGRLRGLPVTELAFAANAITPRSSLLWREGADGLKAVRAIFACLSDHRHEWDIASLANIDVTMPYLAQLSDYCHSTQLHAMESPGRESPYIQIGSDFQKYLGDALNRERRHSIRRKVRVLSEQDHRIVEYTRPDEMEQAIDFAVRVSGASWKQAVNADIASTDASRQFYAEIASHFARVGQVRIWVSFLGDVPIALEYHLTCGERVYFLATDFHKEYAKLSPGTVLLYKVLEQLHGESVSEFDFGGNVYEYKMKWATGVRRHVGVQLCNRNLYSRFIYATKARFLPFVRTIRDLCPRFVLRKGGKDKADTV